MKQYENDRNISKILGDKRLNECFREEWINSAKHCHKGRNYFKLARCEPSLKVYLNFCCKWEIYWTHVENKNWQPYTLSVKVDRYQNRKTYDEFICKSWDQMSIKNLCHIIISELKEKHSLPFMINLDRVEFYTKMNEQ